MGKISRFGLMELSRQRLRPSLSEGSHVTCPRCNGTGHIRDTESSALQVLRIIQEEAMKENSASIHVQAPVDVAAFLLNEKRGEILNIETRHRVSVILIPNKHLETPHYKLERIKLDDPRLEEHQASYTMAEQADTDISYSKRQKEEVKPRQEAVVKGITPDQPAPIVERKSEPVAVSAARPSAEEGFFSKILNFFRPKPALPLVVAAPVAESKSHSNRDRGDRNGRGPRGRGRHREGRNRNEERTGGADVTKQAQPLVAEAQAPRQPRPPKEPREGGNQGGQGRRDRQQRNREERHEAATDNKSEEVLLNTAAAVPTAALVAPLATDQSQTTPNAESSESGEDQPRRRRRRGGRNRNRRERESGEAIEAGAVEAADEESSQAESTAATPTFSATHPESMEVGASAASVERAEPSIVTPPSISANEALPVAPEAATSEVSNLTAAIAAPLAPQEVTRIPEPAPEPARVAEEIQASSHAVAPTAEAPKATPAPVMPNSIVPAPMPVDELRSVLSAAGLTLATTNPDKLRAAQEAAAHIVPAPRVPRARKALPPLPTEPLIQVETQRQ
jgi:ribonuclease E